MTDVQLIMRIAKKNYHLKSAIERGDEASAKQLDKELVMLNRNLKAIRYENDTARTSRR